MNEFKPGLEGVVAFETEIAEPDREGGALRYRGVDIEELVGVRPYEQIWGLLVDDSFEPGMPRAEDVRAPDSYRQRDGRPRVCDRARSPASGGSVSSSTSRTNRPATTSRGSRPP